MKIIRIKKIKIKFIINDIASALNKKSLGIAIFSAIKINTPSLKPIPLKVKGTKESNELALNKKNKDKKSAWKFKDNKRIKITKVWSKSLIIVIIRFTIITGLFFSIWKRVTENPLKWIL